VAVKEFRDDQGAEWRVWEIRPESIHAQTRAEDYLSDCYTVGWLVFQTASGEDKRRLCPYPKNWSRMNDMQLAGLLLQAEPVPPRKLDAERQVVGASDPQPRVDVPPEQDKPDVTDLRVIRSFKYPGGRMWTVCVCEHPEDNGAPSLRFTSGMRHLDLRPWPRDWPDAPNPQLVEMLRRAGQRAPAVPSADTPRRRYNDPPSERRRRARLT
jgi:hypothetical protein